MIENVAVLAGYGFLEDCLVTFAGLVRIRGVKRIANERIKPMNKTIRNLAIAALFIFPGLSGVPQEVQQEETPAAKPVVEENLTFPILIGIP